jgi:hypothetical protein
MGEINGAGLVIWRTRGKRSDARNAAEEAAAALVRDLLNDMRSPGQPQK